MKIRDVMSRSVATCDPQSNLAFAAAQMWEFDCGALPVVSDGRLVGMITDRDIAIASATRLRRTHEIAVSEVIHSDLHVCHVEDDLKAALGIMAQEKVRRLPVVDDEDRLQGIVSLNDLILRAEDATRGRLGMDLTYGDIVRALKDISKHHRQDREHPTLDSARESA
jgi:CBS-domain-containing membrane protein